MKKAVLRITVVLTALTVSLLAAEMSVPILKTTPELISVTTSFSAFEPGAEFRIGVGASGPMDNLEITLKEEGDDVPLGIVDFKQGYMSSWFEVDEVEAKGYTLGSKFSGDRRVTMKVTFPRPVADRLGKFYVFVSKKYGPNIWYLEDGSEIDKSNWGR